MKVKWKNILGVLTLIIFVYLLLHLRPILDAFEDLRFRIYWPYDPVWQFFTLALFCLTAIAIVVVIFRK
jgi:hypothetical protein